ncbi:MAG: triose-phosphate isomerase [Candidatus Caenarcaniphilales bacterium]|nr:triose-phosphate isomerase [Candidatus Caenarcaniphilales bacterium]
MRKPLIIANWKLNKTKAESKAFVAEFSEKIKDSQNDVDVILSAPFTSIETVVTELKTTGLDKVEVAAQDVSQFESGAYTGEINTAMLKELGVTSVIVGHSERREIFNEDNSVIKAKSEKVLKDSLKLIFCCGESLETREANKTDEWIESQINAVFKELDYSTIKEGQISIAYEPIWAIGTGKTCDSEEANRVIANIRTLVKKLLPENLAETVRILYGGSVKPGTIEEQMAKSDIDGALVGGASLKPEDFSQIVNLSAPKAAVK